MKMMRLRMKRLRVMQNGRVKRLWVMEGRGDTETRTGRQ